MYHAPIVIPSIVGDRGAACESSTRAMCAAALRMAQCAPDVTVVLSPHTPRRRGFTVVAVDRIVGDFAAFGACSVGVDMPTSRAAQDRIASCAKALGVLFQEAHADAMNALDFGALVPRYFLEEAKVLGSVVVIGHAREQTASTCHAFGRALAQASEGQRWVVVASGDCSHRLQPGAPAGVVIAGSTEATLTPLGLLGLSRVARDVRAQRRAGEGVAAAGAVEAALSVLSLHRGIIPPSINVDDLDPACAGIDIVRDGAREVRFDDVMSNGFGLGGTNASVIFRGLSRRRTRGRVPRDVRPRRAPFVDFRNRSMPHEVVGHTGNRNATK